MSERKEIKIDVVKIALAVQLAVFGLVGLDIIGINIPVIRQIIMFFYLAFLPGMLILRLQDIGLNLTKTLLFSFGISLVFVTLVSTFADVLLASAGFERPISEIPILISISIAVLLLITACYFKGKSQIPFSYDPHLFSSPLFLSFLLLPLMSILASCLSSIRGNDFLVLLLLAVIAIIPLIVSLDKFPERLYPLIVLSSSISLVFLRFGSFVFKACSLHETGIAGVIKTVGIWVPDFGYTHNSLLYTAILHPVFSTLLDMDIILEKNVIGCLIASFTPLILYEIYSEFFDRKIAALSSFLFMFYPFLRYLLGSRDGFAILFLSLFFLTLVSEEINPVLRKALLILFAFSIIVSHYGNAYFFMLLLFVASIIAFLMSKSARADSDFGMPAFSSLYFVLTFSWYLYTSASTNVNWAVDYGRNVYMHLSEFLSPESSATMQAVFTKWEFAQEVTKYLLFINTFFIAIGVLKLVYDLFKGKALNEYYIFALTFSLGLLVFLLPRIMGTPRVYITLLVILSPFSFIGFSLLSYNFYKFMRIKRKKEYSTVLFSIFLLLLLLFGSGFVSSVMTKVTGTSFDPSDPARWFATPNEYDIAATEWFLHRNIGGEKMYIDHIYMGDIIIREGELDGGYPNFPLVYNGRKVYDIKPFKALPIKDYLKKRGNMEQESYLYLGYHNIVHNFIGTINETGEKVPLRTSDYLPLFEKNSKIYCNGISVIYHVP